MKGYVIFFNQAIEKMGLKLKTWPGFNYFFIFNRKKLFKRNTKGNLNSIKRIEMKIEYFQEEKEIIN